MFRAGFSSFPRLKQSGLALHRSSAVALQIVSMSKPTQFLFADGV
jgi:hypothetical protein